MTQGPRGRRAVVAAGWAVSLVLVAAVAAEESPARVDPRLYQAMEYRNIGPFRGGRVTAVTGVVGNPRTFYMGSTGGGVWKTTDGGETWTNVSDEHFTAGSIGAVAVAPSDPNVVYAGTGSACVRGNVSPGDGVYRSTDAGETWSHVGLRDAGQIGRIRIHPDDPDVAYVAVLGHAFGANEERGVFRTRDGGRSWEKVLDTGDRAGAVDLALDPHNPRNVYAAIWQVVRRPWTLISGGEGSGLYRSTDAGDTWEELTEGLPEGVKGRIGVAASGARRGRVWALVEAEDGGVFRSEDGGATFRRVNEDRSLRQRAWYYTHVHADPEDADTVYVLNVGLWRSTDGGEDFELIRAPHGDHHDLWIDPSDNRILINGNDGGANVSYNAGATWSTQANQPTGEFYRVSVDDRFPYRLCGGQQDNSTVCIPGRTPDSGITRRHWYPAAGCESGHVVVHPRDPDVTYGGCYGGSIERHDRSTGQTREITVYPELAVGQAARDLRYRFQWNAPIRISPHDPRILYHCSQFVHRSTNEGQSWETVSPDLTRDDPAKQDYAGGPITRDNTGVEVYGTIFAFEPSPHRPGLLWAGSDDGRVHVSKDDAATWTDVTPKGMPEWAQVNSIELSPHDPGRAFLAVTRYRLDDFRPYVFRTDDYGRSWDLLTGGDNGIPDDHFVRVVREDPDRRGLLYAGTEFGIYVSFDDGGRWQSLQLNLPVTPITDMAVEDQDLVVATQGRAFWILDDLTPLHRMTGEVAHEPAFLFAPRSTHRFGGGPSFRRGRPVGSNPPSGALIHYVLAESPDEDEEWVLEILDGDGEVLRTFSSVEPERKAWTPRALYFPELAEPKKLDTEVGMNRLVWDLRLSDAEILDRAVLWGSARGPRVPPGTYRVRLSLGDWSQTRSFDVEKDPRLETTAEDFRAQYSLAREIWNALNESHHALAGIRDLREQVDDLVRRLDETGAAPDGLEALSERIGTRLTTIEEAIHQTRAESGQDVLNFPPRLDNQLVALLGRVDGSDARPTDGAYERYRDLRAELDRKLEEWNEVIATDVREINALLRSEGVRPIVAPR